MGWKRQKPQAELRIPTIPTFPLSSPITEEVVTPISSSSSTNGRDVEKLHPLDYVAKMSSQNPFAHKVEYERWKENKDHMREANSFYYVQQQAQNACSPKPDVEKAPERPVGLNLITDFSSPSQQPQDDTAEPTLLDLHDLKILSKEREEERSVQHLKGILKKGMAQGSQRLPEAELDSKRRRSSLFDWKAKGSPKRKGKSDLSPSDRPIMIGFSMPREEPATMLRVTTKGLDVADNQCTPLTPSIVVTPAKDDDPWAGFSQVCHPPRVASSIYSVSTPCLEKSELGIPPVPAIPAHHAASKAEIVAQDLPKRQSLGSTRKRRAYSTGTVFEEDMQSRPGLRPRSYSSENAKIAFDRLSGFDRMSRLSINSEVNRHRSQGWWTYLLSPLLGRSNTMSSRKTLVGPRPPTVPSIATDVTGPSDEWWEKEVSYFSPDTPETAVANRGRASWQPSQNNPFADEKAAIEDQTENMNDSSAMSMERTVQGAAAEYYQACAHELFSGTPYFECINHVCSITPQDKMPLFDPETPPDSRQRNKGLLINIDDTPKPAHEESVIPRSTNAPSTSSWLSSTVVDNEFETPMGSPKKDKWYKERTTMPPKTESPVIMPKEITEEPEKAPAANNKKEGQGHNPFVQPTLPASTFPSHVTNVYVQSAPGPSSVPHTTTERIVPQLIVMPPSSHASQSSEVPPPTKQPPSPNPVSPGLQHETEKAGSIPMSDMHNSPAPAYTSHRTTPATLPPRIEPFPIAREATALPFPDRERNETRRRRREKEDQMGRKAGGLWRGRGCFSNKGCFGRLGREGRLRRRWYMAIASFFIVIVVIAVILAIMLTRKGDETPVQSQWLNLTGYPPMPTGISTVAGPEPQVQNSGCITPSTLWSCSLPNEQQSANKPYAANQPNFRFEIRFRNGTYPNSTTLASSNLHPRSPDDLFNPSPSAPSTKDQTFLGNTTDKNSAPFAGEETPFYMSLLSPIKLSQHSRRASFPDIDSLIPSPSTTQDGTAAEATLYPLATSQPLRLYNRDQETEHYGFYTYFDRSIFLESDAPLTNSNKDTFAADTTGGPTKSSARVRCTWSQTRFLVQIWTKPGKSLVSTSASATPSPTATSTNNSASNFVRPGSFPYPVSITLDRHGGAAKDKMVYCYGIEDGHVNATEKKLQLEDRGFGGSLVNPAPGIFNTSGEADKGDLGGFDGGSGGCSCLWTNWVRNS
ncbi:hypothetical protein BDV25DRAFT_129680 [Aspergillus avenaceus]|uniref:Glycoprotease family protein n=1 Tax=Aspergillus avenaceus TaxID=36643 RepID=A0A5N6TW44_ASPAV|nr:hypothetical protein BDV25DRAFT_129680 [Aspergillus avenaceus]